VVGLHAELAELGGASATEIVQSPRRNAQALVIAAR
jgi:hypothetical protein